MADDDKARSDLIGIRSDEPIETVAARVSRALGVTLTPHESSHWGDPYYSAWPASEVKLTMNLDPMFQEGDPPEERWFNAERRDANYLLWEQPDTGSAVTALRREGLDAKPV